MTEAEWRNGDDVQAMWERATEANIGRKSRLLTVSLCRCLWPVLTHPLSRAAVEVAERYADGAASEDERVEACIAANGVEVFAACPPHESHEYAIHAAVNAAMMEHHLHDSFDTALVSLKVAENAEARFKVAALLRDIFGNPFRPVTFPNSWRTEHTVGIATKMYEHRDFAAVPILADALEEAGCDNADVLTHCREPGVHVRGCWVVDLVLGKA